MPSPRRKSLGKYVRGLAPPVAVLLVLIGGLAYALYGQASIWQESDEENLREWVSQSRIFRQTLPELVRDYLRMAGGSANAGELQLKAEEIHEHLQALGNPLKMFPNQLPLFPAVYRLEIVFAKGPALSGIVWDSQWPRDPTQVQTLVHSLHENAELRIEYHLHAFTKHQQEEQRQRWLFLGLSALVIAGFVVAAVWVYLFLKRERERELQRLVAQQQIDRAEKLALENELRRKEVEQRHDEMERKLLEQRVATHEAEQQTLEMKSQLYANIGIMAGSYAHNIKNLLVRPNDLLRRCLETNGVAGEQEHMIQEVQHTLGTVTERLQQILRTVRRDPSRSELNRVDLNAIVGEIQRTWQEMAVQKWKLSLKVEPWPAPLPIEGDPSHLMQAVENLFFNARDATFEMRSWQREQARKDARLSEDDRRLAVIAAASWQGEVRLRTLKEDNAAVLEVTDNGIGMDDEVRRRCVEPHFSTKRDNALFEGNTTGMGLGLSFVQTILEHHHGEMEIKTRPQEGTTFRLRFPIL